MHVAAILDTILALWRDFSDIAMEGAVWMFDLRREGSLLDHCEENDRWWIDQTKECRGPDITKACW
jgi:hypothetical protein